MGGWCECVFEEDGVVGVDLGGEGAEGVNGWGGDVIGNGDEGGGGVFVEFGDGWGVEGVQGDGAGGFEDDFGFEVAHFVDFVGEGVPAVLSGEDADGVGGADGEGLDGDFGGVTALVGEGVVRGWEGLGGGRFQGVF